MKTKHLHDMVVEAIIKRGAIETEATSRKYRKFHHPSGGGEFYFVGKNGALRRGRSATNSVSLERGEFYRGILRAYHDQLPSKEAELPSSERD